MRKKGKHISPRGPSGRCEMCAERIMTISLQQTVRIAYVWIIILIRWVVASLLCLVHTLHALTVCKENAKLDSPRLHLDMLDIFRWTVVVSFSRLSIRSHRYHQLKSHWDREGEQNVISSPMHSSHVNIFSLSHHARRHHQAMVIVKPVVAL